MTQDHLSGLKVNTKVLKGESVREGDVMMDAKIRMMPCLALKMEEGATSQ